MSTYWPAGPAPGARLLDVLGETFGRSDSCRVQDSWAFWCGRQQPPPGIQARVSKREEFPGNASSLVVRNGGAVGVGWWDLAVTMSSVTATATTMSAPTAATTIRRERQGEVNRTEVAEVISHLRPSVHRWGLESQEYREPGSVVGDVGSYYRVAAECCASRPRL